MARQKLDKEVRKALTDARKIIAAAAEANVNEAETRSRVERMFESLMDYDVFKHLTREFATHGVGDSEYCDFAIRLDESSKPIMMVELKRVNTDLSPKHLKQTVSYAINTGCEWALLTNGQEWQIYHISFEQPPQIKLVDSWNLINDDNIKLAGKFELICYKNVKRGELNRLWEKSNVLTPQNVLKSILSEESLSLIRRRIKRSAGIGVTPEEVVGAIRRLLNETAVAEMEQIKISLPVKKRRLQKTVQNECGTNKLPEATTQQPPAMTDR
jgi:predicted type IV restriction endonuclease